MTNKETKGLHTLTLHEKIGQLFFIGIPGLTIDEDTQALLDDVKPGGVCLFARNIKTPEQTRELLENLTDGFEISPFLSVDQEGGLVDRLRRLMVPAPAAAKFKKIEDVREFGKITAAALTILGFNMDFAPVVDVITTEREDAGNGMYSRGYGHSREASVQLAGCFIETLQENGIIGCLKHFPGLGAARSDSHEELPHIDVSIDELRLTDLYPYMQLLGQNAKMVMVAHAAYPNVPLQQKDQDGRLLPSSLNFSIVSKLLRDELDFKGVAITDDLEMGAIVKNYGIGEACKLAILAGNDMLAICADPEAIRLGFRAVVAAIKEGVIDEGRIDRSVERVLHLKSKVGRLPDFDVKRLNELTADLANLSARLN